MTKLKQIRSLLKEVGEWRQYKDKFKHKQMKLLFSKVALIFNNTLEVKKLYGIEKNLLKTKFHKDMFVQTYSQMNKLNKDKYAWSSFGKFVFYIYQTSTYWKDAKLKIHNIFNENNFVEINKEKRLFYAKWLYSLSNKEIDYNKKIISILKEVF